MSNRVIEIGLSEEEINRAIRELELYKADFLNKVDILREKVADKLAFEAQNGFNNAIVDDVIKGGKKFANVNVSVSNQGSLSVVIASGEDAVWVEFGAGVHHNGAIGSSPNPNGKRIGYTIGGYGKGNGKKETWGYYDSDTGELKLTHGTPATMPMYHATQMVCNEIKSIAREVFG